jgi:hypothetical protein
MSFLSYGHYKATGIPWLELLPNNWHLTSFRRHVEIAEGQVNPEDSSFSLMPLIAPNHVKSTVHVIVDFTRFGV